MSMTFPWDDDPEMEGEEQFERLAGKVPGALDVLGTALTQTEQNQPCLSRVVASGFVLLGWAMIVRATQDDDLTGEHDTEEDW